MKKVAWVYIAAVIIPSLILAGMAFSSITNQHLVTREQHEQLGRVLAKDYATVAARVVSSQELEFVRQVEALLEEEEPARLAEVFDEKIREVWPDAEVGFSVSLASFACPSPAMDSRPEARDFRLQNLQFLCSASPADVYWSPKSLTGLPVGKRRMLEKSAGVSPADATGATSVAFAEIVGEDDSGMLARFLQDELNVWTWFRDERDRNLVFGAKLDMDRFEAVFRNGLDKSTRARMPEVWRRGAPNYHLAFDVCVAILDDKGIPVARTHPKFETDWKQALATVEIGDALPHWRVAVYHLNWGQFVESTAKTVGLLLLLFVVLIVAIAVGSFLIVADVHRQLKLARQKTDFVSNVSHELKTPLTSIRMFSELLAEERDTTPEKRRRFLGIITAETARLSRLINNVLDFSRMERGEKKYDFKRCDLRGIVEDAVESCRPKLEESGFDLRFDAPENTVAVDGDRDALSQVILNLLSNAEKYSAGAGKEIVVRITRSGVPVEHAAIEVLDRGLGVPKGSEERIFEKFYRADDSLDSGIEGSGLGLTLARQITRAHGGDLVYAPRDGGGSAFTCPLPAAKEAS